MLKVNNFKVSGSRVVTILKLKAALCTACASLRLCVRVCVCVESSTPVSFTSCSSVLPLHSPPPPTEIDALYHKRTELRESFRQQQNDYMKASQETRKVQQEEREEEARRRKADYESRRMRQ